MPIKLKLSEIVTDAGTQVRVCMNEATVAEYAEALAEGAKFPPVVVFHDGNRYLAADGFHRIQAAVKTGMTDIECDIRQGNKAEALRYALGCNAHHGLRRTNADKRHAVELGVREFSDLSDKVLAEMCAVHHELVADVRKLNPTESVGLTSPPKRIGQDGRVRRLPPPPVKRPGGTVKCTGSTPPPPAQVLDGIGWPIPNQLTSIWQRSDEVQEMLTMLSRVKGILRDGQQNKDKLFLEVNFSSALSHLDQAWTDIKTAKPYAVCPTCQGQIPDQCTLCNGRGLISEHRWNTCVTKEDKEFRFKAKGSK